MPRPQFSLKTSLWLMALVATFIGGAAWNDRQYKTQRSDYIWLINGQEKKFEQFILERRKLRRELRETIEQLRLQRNRAEKPALLADKPATSQATSSETQE